MAKIRIILVCSLEPKQIFGILKYFFYFKIFFGIQIPKMYLDIRRIKHFSAVTIKYSQIV